MGFASLDLAAAVVIALLAFVYVGWTYKSGSASDYHTADRKAGPIRTAASLFTVVGAPHFAIFTTLAFLYGWLALVFYLGTLTGLCVLALIAPRIRSYADAHTFSDIASAEIGRLPAFLLTITGVLFTVGVVIAQLILGAGILQGVTGLDYTWGVVLLVLTIVAYLLPGGYRALISTDVIQGAIMLLFTLILASFLIATLGGNLSGFVDISSQVKAPTVPFLPLLYLGGVLAVMGAPEIWQRVLSAASDGVARRGLVASGLMMLGWGGLVVATGVAISQLAPGADPGNAFVAYVTGHLPPWLLGSVGVLVIAAILSTADTEIFASAILAYKEWQRARGTTTPLKIGSTRILVVAFSLLALGAAIVFRDLMTAWGVLLNLAYITAPLALAIVLRRGGRTRSTRVVVFAISFVGAIATLIYVALSSNDFFSWPALAMIGIASLPLLIPGRPTSAQPVLDSVA